MADFSTEFLFSLTAKLDKPLDVGQTPQSTARFFMPPVVILTDPNYVVWFFPGVEIGWRIRGDGAAELDVRATLRTDQRLRFKNKLFSLDATIVELCLEMFDWARYRQTKGAIKLHVLLDHDGYLPVYAHVTEGNVAEMILPSVGSLYTHSVMRRRQEDEKTPTVVVRKIREAILDEVFLPGDWLPELDLAKRFHVSRSPIREALQALENEGTVVTETRKGAMVRPLSVKEALDIAEIRLDLITFAVKTAYPHLSAGDFDLAYGLAKQITQSNSTKEQFEVNQRFWDIIFEASRRPVRWEIFKQLDHRTTRYYPLMLRLFPAPKTRPLQREALVEFYRKGKIDEALAAFKKFYFEVVHKVIAYLEA